MRNAVILCVLATLPSGYAGSEQIQLTLDPAGSQVSFVLGATLHSVHGSFQLERGTVLYDPTTGAASGEIVVDARSGDSHNEKRDRDMHGKVLESETYPSFVFRPDQIDGELPSAGPTTLTVRGTINMHGGGHPLEVPVTVTVEGAAVRLTAEFEVPYVEWGLKNPSKLLLRVSKEVTVTVQAVGTVTDVDVPAASPQEP